LPHLPHFSFALFKNFIMPKSIFDIQIAGDEGLVEFESAARELVNTKYILADKKISILLQTIAKNKNLYALIANCVQGFDFKLEFNNAKTEGAKGLTLPTERKKLIAFVFCLLLSFDTNQTDLKKFLNTFYFSPLGPSSEFESFAHQAIIPFSQAITKAYYAEAEAPPYAAPPPKTETLYQHTQSNQYHNTQGKIYSEPHVETVKIDSVPYSESQVVLQDSGLDMLAVASLLQSARELIGIIARDSSLNLKEREELLLVCEAFEQAITLGAKKPIRTMFVALKCTLRCSSIVRQLEIQMDNLERLIQEYNLD